MDSRQKLTSQPYQYDPLKQDEIRLLRLKKATGDGVVECEINSFPRHKSPKYEALSYTWGPISPSRKILVNGRPFIIRKNLLEFFLLARSGKIMPAKPSRLQTTHMELPDVLLNSYRPKYLWIDQICIDQSSSSEKSDQVRRMDETYEGASRVVVWLGVGTLHSACIMAKIAQLSRLASMRTLAATLKEHPEWKAEHEKPEPPPGYISWNRFIDDNVEALNVMGDFFKLEYWSRVWIVQEILLSRDAIFVWGDSYAQLADMSASCFEFFFKSEHIERIMARSATCWDECSWANLDSQSIHKVTDLLHDREKVLQIRKLDLAGVLKKHMHKSCENPVDRVYGLLNITNYAGIIDVDYTKPLVHLYLELVGKLSRSFECASPGFLFEVGNTMRVTGDEPEWYLVIAGHHDAHAYGLKVFEFCGLRKEMFKDVEGSLRQLREWKEKDRLHWHETPFAYDPPPSMPSPSWYIVTAAPQ